MNLLLPLSTVRPSIYQAGVVSLRPLSAEEGAETHHLCMKKICYEYEVDGTGCLNHNLKHVPCE